MSVADPIRVQAAIKVFAEPDRWTVGFYARDAHGIFIGFDKAAAVRFDIEGALLKGGCRIGGPEWMIVRDIVRERGFVNPHAFNMAIGCSQAAVVAVLEEARDQAEKALKPVPRIVA